MDERLSVKLIADIIKNNRGKQTVEFSHSLLIAIHRIAGSTHTVPGTLTTECDLIKSIPLRIAFGGMSMAFSTCWKSYNNTVS